MTAAVLPGHRLGRTDERSAEAGPLHDRVLVYGRYILLVPESGCARCVARRWQAVRPTEVREVVETGGATLEAGAWPFANPFVETAVRAVAEATAGGGDVFTVDAQTLGVQRLRLIADEECPVCGHRVPDEPLEWKLAGSPKSAPESFRVHAAAHYPLDAHSMVSPVCGPFGAHVWSDLASTSTAAVVGMFHARSDRMLRELLYGGHANSYAASLRQGLLEGLERHAGLRATSKSTTVVASLDDLGDEALDPRETGLYSDDFYGAVPFVDPFRPDRPIPWVWGWSFRDRRPVLVPEISVYYFRSPLRDRFVQECSSGCAIGGTLAEAVYHGLMEVLERDAFLLAWYGGRPLPEIDPATSARPQTRMMVDRLAMLGYSARFFDSRVTFDIPVVTGVAERLDGGFGTLAFGGGASLDPEAAMEAALCEIASDSVKVVSRARREEPRLRSMVTDYTKVWDLHDHPLLYALPEMRRHAAFLLDDGPAARSVSDTYAGLRAALPLSDDIGDDLEMCVRAVAEAGFDVIAVDQTSPMQRDLGLHTACVIVPGLLPIDFGWARQRVLTMPRLRTAHREAGVRDSDLSQEEIHAVPHPYP